MDAKVLFPGERKGLWLFLFCPEDSFSSTSIRYGETERNMKRNRNAHRKILTITAMAMCAADPDSLRIREANRSFVNLFGYSLREALTLTLHDLTAQDRESVDYTCKIALPTWRSERKT